MMNVLSVNDLRGQNIERFKKKGREKKAGGQGVYADQGGMNDNEGAQGRGRRSGVGRGWMGL